MTLTLQRLRQNSAMRQLVQEIHLSPQQMVQPVFVGESLHEPVPIESMPGIYRHTQESLMQEVSELVALGIRGILLFGIPAMKDHQATQAYQENGCVQQAIRRIKHQFPTLIVMADCCLCEYTDHGHCLLGTHQQTLDTLVRIACSYATAGADIVAPSGMVDGMVGAIRKGLDQAGFDHTLVLSYAVKYASSFYGPFREASGSGDVFVGNRQHHQLSPYQRRESLREAVLDEQEGADILMIKPGLAYLDILAQVRQQTHLPLAIYQVSGEYSMLKLAAKAGIVDEWAAFEESFIAFRRAGADFIVTYYAKQWAQGLI